uniref:Zgc:171482 n=1 Tax=Scleropages formosus TaxID=113540 RepID=A0A8C9SCN5_SCLFO
MKSAGAADGGLFTESYCNICNAQLISESQRIAHYESKKHANKVRLFYMLHPEDGGPPSKRLRPDNADSDENAVDQNKCCTLCNMFFTSAIVAQSHYQGKTHAKRVRLVLGEPPSMPPPTGKGTPNSPASHPRRVKKHMILVRGSLTVQMCNPNNGSVAGHELWTRGTQVQVPLPPCIGLDLIPSLHAALLVTCQLGARSTNTLPLDHL